MVIERPAPDKRIAVRIGLYFCAVDIKLSERDKTFFLLSSFIFAFSCIRTAALFLKVKGKSYTVLEGVCTGFCPKLFVKYREVYLIDTEGVSHTLPVGKDYKIRTGCFYRFHFLSPPESLKENCPWMEKAMLADSLLGVELLEDIPDSGTASSL